MAEFSASVLLEAEVDQSSLRSARAQIEDDIGSVPASATDQIANSGSNSGANTTAILEDNLDLDQERNSLLKDLVDAQEMTARSGGGGGLNGLLRTGARGAMMIGGGGAALVSVLASVNWTSVMSEAMPDIKPSDVVDKTKVTASDLIDDAADVSASDVVDSAAGVASSDLVDTAAEVAATALIANPATIGAAHLIDSAAEVASDDLIDSTASVVPSDLIDTAAKITASAVVSSPVVLAVSNLIKEPVELSPSDIINPSGSGDPSGDGSPSGDGGGDGLPIAEAVGGGAIAAGLFKALGGSGALSRILGASSGAALFTPEMFEDTAFGDLTMDPEDVDSDKPTLAEIVTGTASDGSDPSSSIDGNPVNFSTSGDGTVKKWVSSIQQSQSERTPAWRQQEPVTVGGDGSNRNETSGGRDGQLEFTGSIDHNVTVTQDFEHDIKKQLRRNGVPRALIDAILDELDREVR